MSTLENSLLTKDIHLDLRATDQGDALEEVLATLRSDARVKDWEKLRGSLQGGAVIDCMQEECGTMILHHRRTESVSGLVLAVGRSARGIPMRNSGKTIRLLIVAAIPEELNTEYLRILGALSRVCGETASFNELLSVPDRESFLALLEKGCRR
jgi:mannitol/fructose-specific phosphotransferase system IIA component (Ntr-type)